MILDAENLFSDRQAVTATAVSENVIDLGASDAGPGEPLSVLIQVTEDFAGLTSLKVEVETDDDSGFGSAKTLNSSDVVPVADLVAGKQFAINALPHGLGRYVRLNYVAVGTATDGTVTAGIVFDKQQGFGHAI